MALCLSRCVGTHERQVADRKRDLLSDLSGTILELGPGTGINLPYYHPGVRWIGVEPNPFLHPYLQGAAARLGMRITILDGTAERLPIADGSVAAVVSSLVLCSVRDLAVSLREVQRVLRPGGRYVFLEHVAAPPGTWLRRLQRWLRPLIRFLADGCRPDRETWRALEAAGFAPLRLEHFRVRVPIVSPHIAGVAVKPAEI
jgi:ubiquinone/menaquinone biosynthesis C-methylase UbiE